MGIGSYKKRLESLEDGLAGAFSRIVIVHMDNPEEKAALDAGQIDTTGALVVLIERVGADPPNWTPPAPVFEIKPPDATRAIEPSPDDTPTAPEPEHPAAVTVAPRATTNKDFLKGVERWFQS